MRRVIKRGFAFLLAGIMMLSLAACGKSGEDADSKEPAKEFVYVPEYKELPLEKNSYMDTIKSYGDDLFFISSIFDEDKGTSQYNLYRYNLLSEELKQMPLELNEQSFVQQMAFDSQGNLLLIVNKTVVKGQEGTQDQENTGDTQDKVPATDSNEETSSGAKSGVVTVGGTTGGESDIENVLLSVTSSATAVMEQPAQEPETESVGESIEYENTIELWTVSAADGSVMSAVDIQSVLDELGNQYIQYFAVDAQDNIYICDGDSSVFVMDKTGKKLFTAAVENWISNLFESKEGNVYVSTYGAEGIEMRPVDIQSKSIGSAVGTNVLGNDNNNFFKGAEKGILISGSSSVFSYDFETDTKEELFNWLDADLNSDYVNAMGQLSDGRFWAVLRDYELEQAQYSLVLLTKTKATEVPQKEELVYGTLWLDQKVRKNIINFNKSNDQYRVTVKEYATDDYTTGLTNFNADISSGKGPDIIDIYNIDFKQYASKGVLEDLYPYMEKDGINKSDYLENVLQAYELDGKMYGIIPQFYINTTLVKASKVAAEGWTLSEMLDFVEGSNAENIFQYGNRNSIFYFCIYNNIDEFINWENGECSFNGEDFIRVLEFANQFPEEVNFNQEEDGISTRLREDKVLLMQTSISSVQDYQMMKGLFGEEVSFVGYPNSDRKGNLIQPTSGSMAINAKGENKEGAWNFIKTILSDEYQNSLVETYVSYGFPVKKSALDKQFEVDMTPTYYDNDDGEKVEQPKTTWGWDDFEMEIYASTQEEVDAVKAIIASAERTAGSVNEELTNIITEETAPYFKGQKNAQETADIIQSRIQIYVKENS